MKKIMWILCLTVVGIAQVQAQEFGTLDENISLRVEGWWRVAQEDDLDRVFFNATFRNDGTISRFLANLFDYRLTVTSGEVYKGTVTMSECYFDFGWDPWSSPCGDRVQPGSMGYVVIGFRNVAREGYPSRLTILVRDQETVAREYRVPETTIGLMVLILASGLGTQILRRRNLP